MIPGTLYLDAGVNLITFALYDHRVGLAYDYDTNWFELWATSVNAMKFKEVIV